MDEGPHAMARHSKITSRLGLLLYLLKVIVLATGERERAARAFT